MAGIGPEIARGSRTTVHLWGGREDLVAKVPLGPTPDSWISADTAYATAAAMLGVRVPGQFGTRCIAGRTVGLSRRVRGCSLWDLVLAFPDEAAAYGRALATVELSLLATRPSALLPRQRDRLASKIRAAAAVHGSDLLRALHVLDELDAPGSVSALCHGDLHPRNVLVTDDGPVIIDWFDACRGAPVVEVARSSLLLVPISPAVGVPAHLVPEAGLGPVLVALHDAYLAEVASELGLDPRAVDRWRSVQAAARLAEGMDTETLPAVRAALDRFTT